jgi:BirA family biotin operon repressor/biotin-[acetyl-CoA-carboxylase] ligase
MDQRNKKIIYLNEVESTNNYANQLILSDAAEEGTVVLAQYQTHGKGQHGNVWESETGKNLLMSIIWYPGFLPASQQFMISKIVSIAITDCVNDIIDDCKIKWPNDIYIGNQKLAGILIENSVKGSHLSSSVVGIGLNVNQQVFISAAPNPVSLFQITGVIYEISELM